MGGAGKLSGTCLSIRKIKFYALPYFADVMLPGVLVPEGGLPQFREGEVFSVLVPGNPCPIAVSPWPLDLGPECVQVMHVVSDAGGLDRDFI